MNLIMWGDTAASTSTFAKTKSPEPLKEYLGMACPECYKPIGVPSGSSDPKFCPHDHSGWEKDYRDPIDVFEQSTDNWQMTDFTAGMAFAGE